MSPNEGMFTFPFWEEDGSYIAPILLTIQLSYRLVVGISA